MAPRDSETQDSVPSEQMPPDRPSPARMYDYYLGGFHNFAVDRKAAEQAITVFPDFPMVARANRAFLRRAVRYLIDAGIDQFLDIGSGIPTVGNVHEAAQERNPEARVVYVDIDPIAVTHSRKLLAANPRATVIQADARQAEQVLGNPELQRMLDPAKPVGVLLIAFLHFVTDDAHAEGIVRAFREAMAPGSYLALSHTCAYDNLPIEVVQQLVAIYSRSTNPAKPRSREAIRHYFDGLELAPPGIVYAPLWRPEGPDDVFLNEPERSIVFAGVGRKPGPKGPGDEAGRRPDW